MGSSRGAPTKALPGTGSDELDFFTHILDPLEEYRTLCAAVADRRLPAAVSGLPDVHKAHLIFSLCRRVKRRALVLAADEQQASRMCMDLDMLFGGGVYFFPSRDLTLRPVEGVSREYEHERLRIFGRMLTGDYAAVVTCADAAMQLTIPPARYRASSVEIRQGMSISPARAVEALLAAGYRRCDQVDGSGQFALRGGILDFFPTDADHPVRAEFWGDEIDSMTFFETETQRRTDPVEAVTITPAREVLFPSSHALAEGIGSILTGKFGKVAPKAQQSFQTDLELLGGGAEPAALDRYLGLCYDKPATLYDYAGDSLLFVSEESRVHERAKHTLWQHGEDISALLEEGMFCRGLDRFYIDWPRMLTEYENRGAVYLETFARSAYETDVRFTCSFTVRQLAVWGGGLKVLLEDLAPHIREGGSAVVAAGTGRSCETLAHDLREQQIPARVLPPGEETKPPAKGEVLVVPGRFSAGFEYPALRFLVLTYGGTPAAAGRMRARKHKPGERIRNLAELTPGDYVVHSAHGIGIYEGIQKLEVQGIVKDYIKIRYAGSDTLYVPVTQLDLVSKYIGARDDGAVRLNKMGGSEWQKAKSRVRSAVKDMAKELIALYAARQQVKGIAFPDDDDMQQSFEDRFEYDETGDQLRCAAEIKADMEKACPMDRLLCGDVGFGKTEVALRAAFKCLEAGYQCALLVPTTILAWQHYQTISKRFESFPVKVELLSRFRSPKQQEDILHRLGRGEIDIIVGTHRLVQKDVRFRKLGLVIVDEEQRFGVAQKEKLKDMFRNVDVLTLSATPIPRTLNMALSGIRDMSVIEEAPQDRHPVQTYVLEHDWGLIGDAIRRELRRGGQVYYLHNRVETIELTAHRIHQLVPDARIGIAHGKMEEDKLSVVWERLLNNEIDVLVCTTIIETGVDVSNCNTLIIEDADRMGLSQLHQIRGRVGRSARRAFAYFTFRRGKALSDIATKRLSAIREFTEFGAGFQIAMRDLEIRGAGNILGAQQHGHMESVGYDMYLRLLNDAVLEEKGEKPATAAECMVDVQVTAHIPEEYIANAGQRLEIYRRIADIHTPEDMSDVIDELIDRFGDLPPAVKSLVDVALLRNTAAGLGIGEIAQRGEALLFYPEHVDFQAVSALVARLRGRVMVNAGQKPYISVKIKPGQTPLDTMRETLDILRTAKDAASQAGEQAAGR